MKYKLKQTMRIGDLANWVDVDELEIKSLSLVFDPQEPVLSIVLLHVQSGWTHNIVYRDPSAVEFWASTFDAEFSFLNKVLMQKIIADKKLPEGELIE